MISFRRANCASKKGNGGRSMHALNLEWFFPVFWGLFLGVLAMTLHEAAHLIAALAVGVKIKKIGFRWKGLYIVREAGTPGKNALVSLAGPLANLALLFTGIGRRSSASPICVSPSSTSCRCKVPMASVCGCAGGRCRKKVPKRRKQWSFCQGARQKQSWLRIQRRLSVLGQPRAGLRMNTKPVRASAITRLSPIRQ